MAFSHSRLCQNLRPFRYLLRLARCCASALFGGERDRNYPAVEQATLWALNNIGKFDSSHFDFFHGVVGPVGQCVFTDYFDLDWAACGIGFLVISLLVRLGLELFQKSQDQRALP